MTLTSQRWVRPGRLARAGGASPVAVAAGPIGGSPLTRAVVTAVAIAALPGAWAVLAATGWLGPGFVGPVDTVRTLHDEWSMIWYNARPTLSATVTGAVILLAVTVLGMMVVAVIPAIATALGGLSVVVGSLPLIAVTPALALVITRGARLVTTVTVLSGLVPVAAMLVGAAVAAARGREDLGALYATPRLRWWRHVGFWHTVPVLDLGLRAMLPACFVGAIVAEWSGATGTRGLGQVMVNALFSYQPALLWASLLVAAAAALGLFAIAAAIMAPLRRRVR
ncbi:putative ABC transporter permease protein [Frankia canadensis]|uniref:Putative ABC transporter permease protein n=1 Tax=Frankia canadensis TaxID=1836972 RepID=A0A2I2KXQ2_9ACTN|nr:ABC transporter permease [Frankia canadensis]SNQ50441.1 putative ABC transporter permease protein [Frankia canadensis]SOU57731.1 putative ABC transporter permease protein [Frankia canadensis]